MTDKTRIEWTDATWNPIRGCTRVSSGCRNCYAETMAARFSGPGQAYEGLAYRTKGGQALWTGKVMFLPEKLDQPLRWRRPRRVFVNSMSDLFHEALSFQQIAAIFGVMAAAQRHQFQVLTKRPETMLRFFEWLERYPKWRRSHILAGASEAAGVRTNACDSDVWPLPNVCLGVSVEDQTTAHERIPFLLQCPAAVRWVSAEPLLGVVELGPYLLPHGEYDEPSSAWAGSYPHTPALDWVVVGGESGPRARPMHPEWVRSIRDQCVSAGVPFFFKQWGEWAPWDDDNWSLPDGADDVEARDHVLARSGVDFLRVGKKAAGRKLDGREWNEQPQGRRA